jgi:Tfp pilus assembly protein PilV
MTSTTARRRQRGVSTLESLIAFAVLALGMIGLARVQVDLRASAESARERSQAVRLAQQDLEELRAFATTAGWDAIGDAEPADVTPPGATTTYRRERSVRADADSGVKAIRVMLRWADRHGTPQSLQLQTLVGASDPALSGALALPRPDL